MRNRGDWVTAAAAAGNRSEELYEHFGDITGEDWGKCLCVCYSPLCGLDLTTPDTTIADGYENINVAAANKAVVSTLFSQLRGHFDTPGPPVWPPGG